MSNQARASVPPALRRFIWDIQSMVELGASEREMLLVGRDLMSRLLAEGEALPAPFRRPDPARGRQLQLYSDLQERFTVVSTVLAGGQALPLCQEPVWEIVGVVQGTVARQRFAVADAAPPRAMADARVLAPGAVDTYAPGRGEAVRLANAQSDGVAVAIHAYGGEIGKLARRVIGADGSVQEIATGYANADDTPPFDIHAIQAEIRD